jgi:hypothetical protein
MLPFAKLYALSEGARLATRELEYFHPDFGLGHFGLREFDVKRIGILKVFYFHGRNSYRKIHHERFIDHEAR